MTVFLRVLEETDDKRAALQRAVRASGSAAGDVRFEVNAVEFKRVPGSPFSYWISDALRRQFVDTALFESEGRVAQFGAVTTYDFRFLRLCWEAPATLIGSRWRLFSKGGIFSPFYADVYLVVDWGTFPAEIDAFICARYEYLKGKSGWLLHPESSFFRPGLTWPLRTKSRLSLRVLPAGCVFGHKGPSAFVEGDDSTRLLALLAITNSRAFYSLVEVQLAAADAKAGGAAHSFELGVIRQTPVPSVPSDDESALAELARAAWGARHRLDRESETSHAFVLPSLLSVDGADLSRRAEMLSTRGQALIVELHEIQSAIDVLCFDLYGIADEDRRAIVESFGVGSDSAAEDHTAAELEDDDDDDDADDGDSEMVGVDLRGLAAGLVSWAVGVAVGRFDVRLATGARSRPEEPDPFDPLPVSSPATLAGDDGRLVDPPAGYPLSVSRVLVDDPGHNLDITGCVRSVFEVVHGERADVWWSDVGAALGARSGDIGSWLRRGFFEHHLKAYSRSRRKAPVLWPIGTKSGSYLVWLYAHRVSGDSLFQVLHDLVMPKLGLEERELTRIRQDAGVTPSASQRKAIDAQERLVGDLRELREELEAAAPLWAPDLNDGIVVVLAPLWRLFAHNRAWSNELKKHWTKLVKGDYDWAQLAMHLWPERVVPKCAEDRSLAIAHGLEDVFWIQDSGTEDKWHPRGEPTISIDQLVAQHQSPATIAALQRAAT